MCGAEPAGDHLSEILSAKQHPAEPQVTIKKCHHQQLLTAVQEGNVLFSIMYNVCHETGETATMVCHTCRAGCASPSVIACQEATEYRYLAECT